MPGIKPSLVSQDIVCAETPAGPNAFVVFRASGDLTKRKLVPALFNLDAKGELSSCTPIICVGRRPLSHSRTLGSGIR